MILIIFAIIFASIFASWRMWRRVRFFLHVFQLESYKPKRYVKWVLTRSRGRVVRVSHMIALPVLLTAWFLYAENGVEWVLVATLFLWGLFFFSSRHYKGSAQKKPLAFTNRLKRLRNCTLIIVGLIFLVAGILGGLNGTREGLFYALFAFFIADLGAPIWVYLATLIMHPVERSIQNGYKKQARKKLSGMPELIKIGITGSYGKTSVKFIVAEIAKQRFNALATPGSYNTPMGICIVVNNHLKADHQVLVLEMGMRYRGDIKELCGIAKPDIAVVTSVGVAHLETMGSIENIALEKGDIVECLDKDGVAVLNIDNSYVAAMEKRAPGTVWKVSAEGNEEADIIARHIHYTPEGAHFEVQDETGQRAPFKTRLLGRHNVLNILLGVAIGRQLGLRLRQIAHAVARVEPVEHRLQLINKGPITVIDDAFNSNPVGAKNAVEVLGAFKSGRRVIVTPGMVELGERQFEENRLLGEHMAHHVDLAVLIGTEQTAPIVEGLKAQQFPDDQTKVFSSFFDAQAFLDSYLSAGDVVLYENDLPDQYNE